MCYRYAPQYTQYMYEELSLSLTTSLDLVSIRAPFTLVKGAPSGKQTRLFIFNYPSVYSLGGARKLFCSVTKN